MAAFLGFPRPMTLVAAAVLVALAVALGAATAGRAQAEPIRIVAAENVYGDVAQQIGGPAVAVTAILVNPDQDPHLFEARASVARAVADARVFIMNGAGYDPWMARLLAASPAPGRVVIDVAALTHRKAGDNPHLWYDPATMPAVAKELAARLIELDPKRRADYEFALTRFRAALLPLEDRIAALKRAYGGTPITATEPAAGYVTEALGLVSRNERFQRAIMNGTEPTASDIAAFQNDLAGRKVRLMLYNSQTTSPLAERLRALATASGIAVVGVRETMPANMHYQDWMLALLAEIEAALAGKRS